MEKKKVEIELVKRHSDTSKYEGDPLIKAEQPYAYQYKYSLSQPENTEVKLSML